MDYNQLTVVKLKEELKERGIPSTNLKLKKDLVDRLVQDDTDKTPGQTDPPSQAQPADAPVKDAPEEPTPSQDHQLPPPEQASEPDAPMSEQQPPPPARPSEVTDTSAVPTSKDVASPQPETDESTSADGKKRKRRSVTPPVSEDVVHKKLKQETDGPVVHLQGDHNPEKSEVPMPDVPLEQSDAVVQPMSTSDDLVQLSANDSDKPRSTRSPHERRFKDLVNSAEPDPASSAPEPSHVTVSPAIHPATRALYIRHLVRPINPAGLKEHLEDVARPPDHSDPSDSLVETCYVDALRTHAFVFFKSLSAASRARASTHARVWPPEPMRKPLWADFFPEERFQEWIDTERASGGSRPSQAKRWELAYDVVGDEVDVRLVEAGPSVHRASIHSGAPNIPTGPRGSMSSGRRPSFPQAEPRRPSQSTLPPPPRRTSRAVEEATAPFLELDKLFKFTTTKPKLYWQPVSEDLADDRLDELDRETSRDWDPRVDARRHGDSLGRGLDQLKRYTFEDGDVIVDGGPEFGGGRAFARGGNRGRGRRTADSYRGN